MIPSHTWHESGSRRRLSTPGYPLILKSGCFSPRSRSRFVSPASFSDSKKTTPLTPGPFCLLYGSQCVTQTSVQCSLESEDWASDLETSNLIQVSLCQNEKGVVLTFKNFPIWDPYFYTDFPFWPSFSWTGTYHYPPPVRRPPVPDKEPDLQPTTYIPIQVRHFKYLDIQILDTI